MSLSRVDQHPAWTRAVPSGVSCPGEVQAIAAYRLLLADYDADQVMTAVSCSRCGPVVAGVRSYGRWLSSSRLIRQDPDRPTFEEAYRGACTRTGWRVRHKAFSSVIRSRRG